MSKSILALLFLLFSVISLPASDSFGEDDFQRLLYTRKAANKTLAGNFLILDKSVGYMIGYSCLFLRLKTPASAGVVI